MSEIPAGPLGLAILLILIALAHESWRWAGLWLGRSVSADSEVFRWVQCVANALVAALVMRLVIFPAGVLADVPLGVRVGALALGLAIFWFGGRRLALGVGASALVLAAGAFGLG